MASNKQNVKLQRPPADSLLFPANVVGFILYIPLYRFTVRGKLSVRSQAFRLSRHLSRLEGGRERRQLGQGTALCQAADKDGRSSWHGVESSPAKAAASNQRFLTGRR